MKKTLFHAALCAMSVALPAFADEAADQKVAAELNRQGFKLFDTVCKADAKKNMFISPFSIDGAFGMVYCGAKGTTADEIRKVLGLPADPAACGAFFDALTKQYAEAEKTEVLVSTSIGQSAFLHIALACHRLSSCRPSYARLSRPQGWKGRRCPMLEVRIKGIRHEDRGADR